ncbi:MAG: hypothetical protein RMM98_09545 [Acidobacteriota bacterium]|nr:hypothetical protein [Blastocatellia bacterium]MDW8239849.1 hypothetical protein [Acidobacteriota bacterium]
MRKFYTPAMNTKSAAVYFEPNALKSTQHHGDAIHHRVAYRLSHLAKLLKLTAGAGCGSDGLSRRCLPLR